MIVAVVADTHGRTDVVIKCLLNIGPDYLLFAGDYFRDGETIARRLKIPASIVAGNCDGVSQDKIEEVVCLMNHKLLLVHGHKYGVKGSLNRLYYRAQELGVDAAVFGHTHSAYCERTDGLWMINPGSPVNPHWAEYGSFAIIEIEENHFYPVIMEIRSDHGQFMQAR